MGLRIVQSDVLPPERRRLRQRPCWVRSQHWRWPRHIGRQRQKRLAHAAVV